MGKIQTWNAIPGLYFIEVDSADPEGYVDVDGNRVPDHLIDTIRHAIPAGRDLGVIDLKFSASGYYDPGQLMGPPERCYPPEGGEERQVYQVDLEFFEPDGFTITFPDCCPKDKLRLWEDYYREQIDAEEIDYGGWDDRDELHDKDDIMRRLWDE